MAPELTLGAPFPGGGEKENTGAGGGVGAGIGASVLGGSAGCGLKVKGGVLISRGLLKAADRAKKLGMLPFELVSSRGWLVDGSPSEGIGFSCAVAGIPNEKGRDVVGGAEETG